MPGGLAEQGRGHRGLSLIPSEHLIQGAALLVLTDARYMGR